MRATVNMFHMTIERHLRRTHVGTSAAVVEREIREAVERFRQAHRDTRISAATEGACVRYALRCHTSNRKEFMFVMGGTR